MTLLITPSMDALAVDMKRWAEMGAFNGYNTHSRYFLYSIRTHHETGTVLRYTRDIGYHSSGWFKNPDYERCYQLSISFHDPQTMLDAPWNPQLARLWVQAFYHQWARFVWDESNSYYRDEVGGLEIHHYRVFCNPKWKPIIPRGEVYSKEFTEKGWKSFSDLRDEKHKKD